MSSDSGETSRPSWKKVLFFSLLAPATLVLLVALAFVWGSWKADDAWQKTQAELRARGEKLTLTELAPSLPPDERNFFADPMWQELADTVETTDSEGHVFREPRLPRGKRRLDVFELPLTADLKVRAKSLLTPKHAPSSSSTSHSTARDAVTLLGESATEPARRELARYILDAYAASEPTRRRLEQLLDRREAGFPTDYSLGFLTSTPHIFYLLKISQAYRNLAAAHLILGDTSSAAREILVTMRLAETIRQQPLLICLLVRVSMIENAIVPMTDGIHRHLWPNECLADFERQLRQVDLLPQLALALRGERGAFNQALTSAREGANREESWRQIAHAINSTGAGALWENRALGLLYRFSSTTDQEYYNRYIQQTLAALERPGGLHARDCPQLPDDGDFLFTTSHLMTTLMGAPLARTIPRTLAQQDAILQTRIACALEQYRFENKTYPSSLAGLAPGFVAPGSVIAGAPMHYRLDSAEGFRLWSAGWDEADGGGSPAGNRGDYLSADWVWGISPGSTSPRP